MQCKQNERIDFIPGSSASNPEITTQRHGYNSSVTSSDRNQQRSTVYDVVELAKSGRENVLWVTLSGQEEAKQGGIPVGLSLKSSEQQAKHKAYFSCLFFPFFMLLFNRQETQAQLLFTTTASIFRIIWHLVL